MKYVINDTTLTAIGDAVREKSGTADKIPVKDIPASILAIETGGGGGGAEIPDEAFVFTGDSNYRFYANNWNWFIDMFGEKITTKDITKACYMFNNSSKLKDIPFDINLKMPTSGLMDITSIFASCNEIKHVPLIKGITGTQSSSSKGGIDMANLFENCYNIREIPNDYFMQMADMNFWKSTHNYGNNRNRLFYNCYSLRALPDLSMLRGKYTNYYSTLYPNLCGQAKVLDKVENLPVLETSTLTSNCFNTTIFGCSRLSKFTFETNDDGSPIKVTGNWSKQTIELSHGTYSSGVPVGCASTKATITTYNSGITADKEVKDDATYQALKNDPDWFTCKMEYCRYNHDSAVETINSLPDVTTGNTNVIKFEGAAGSATDGGAINTLTEEEIAVAAAKGWTVTLV